jgi:curved DNA-binding protein CbpA
MKNEASNLYAILGVGRNCSFDVLKKAYYRRAKECHPDLFGGDAVKEEEFKRVVHAFDVLSDPRNRCRYDDQLAASRCVGDPGIVSPQGPSIMDSIADDILEEMIVGNDVPRNTTLQNLFLDLTRTTRFVAFREAKNFYARGLYRKAYKICRKLVSRSPSNILYHFYLAESCRCLGRYRQARRRYRICLQLGLMRIPPQRLERIRRRYEVLLRKQGWLGRLLTCFMPPAPNLSLSAQDAMLQDLDRAMGHMLKKETRRPACGKRSAGLSTRSTRKFLPR